MCYISSWYSWEFIESTRVFSHIRKRVSSASSPLLASLFFTKSLIIQTGANKPKRRTDKETMIRAWHLTCCFHSPNLSSPEATRPSFSKRFEGEWMSNLTIASLVFTIKLNVCFLSRFLFIFLLVRLLLSIPCANWFTIITELLARYYWIIGTPDIVGSSYYRILCS